MIRHTPYITVSSVRRRLAMMLFTVMAAVFLGACTDDNDIPSGAPQPEGLPAEITLGIDTGEFGQISRADMTPGLDKRVTSLWVAVYNVASGARTGMFVFKDLDESLNHDLRDIKLSTLSGKSYVVAVANYDMRFGFTPGSESPVPLEEALADADTWTKYRSIGVSFDKEFNVNIEAPINALLMSGFYTDSKHTGGSRPSFDVLDIKPGMSRPSGAIHLRRLISQVKFRISYNAKNIKSFTLKSWQVCNLPSATFMHEREDSEELRNVTDIMSADANPFSNSILMSNHGVDGSTYTFDFWQLENRRTGLPPADTYTDDDVYTYREKEFKNADGSNTGKYMSLVDGPDSDDLNNMAGYVRFDVSMEMSVDENGDKIGDDLVTRLVETSYIVHLGYCEGDKPMQKATDFNCRRNTRYTYNVTINNVGDLIVETVKDEKNPAVEGVVSDITGQYYSVDAHYSAVNINLTASDINNFQYYIIAYDLQGSEVVINSLKPATVPAEGTDRFKYLSWIELRPTKSRTVLADYKPRKGKNSDGETYLLSEIADKKPDAGWYTVFVNEYVYEEGKYADGNESGSTAWHGYVNRPERRAWLNVTGNVSDDGVSIHYVSKYAVAQKSIQTYYQLGSPSGLGVEHTNESLGLNLRNGFNPYINTSGGTNSTTTTPGRNRLSGRYNLAQYLVGSTGSSLSWRDDRILWSKFISASKPQTVNAVNNQGIKLDARTASSNPVPLPMIVARNNGNEYNISSFTGYDPDRTSSPKYIEAITACLNRNRDLDGDGYISADELRWFVPTTAQYVRIILGRRSLEDPLVDFTTYSRLPNNSGTNNGYNSSLLFYTSDGRMMWMMEGTSESEWRQWPSSCAAPWEVRCVRNLGGNQTVINADNVTQPAFMRREGTNIIDLKYYESRSIREEAYQSSTYPMPVHHLYDQRYNRCYKAFEFFDSILPLNDSRLGLYGKNIEWSSYLQKNNPCAALNYTGKRGWRVPNQKEMTILGILGLQNLNSLGSTMYLLTSTYSYFDFSGYAPGSNPYDPDGTISGVYRFPMKVIVSSGITTQSDAVNNVTISNAYYGVRCVRDVVE